MFVESSSSLLSARLNRCISSHICRYWSLSDALSVYESIWPSDGVVRELRKLVNSGPSVFDRDNQAGHVTASSWIVSTDNKRVLLTHHRKLKKWVQLGGHADGDQCLPRVALREAYEESGLQELKVLPEIFSLEKYSIPPCLSVSAHWHYDVCFLVRCIGSEAYSVSEESIDLAWRDVFGLFHDNNVEPSIRKLSERWIRNGTSGSCNEIRRLVAAAGYKSSFD